MGDRANYVVMEDGAWQLYFSNWGATRLDLDLIAGPEAATRFIRAQRPMGGSADGDSQWLDDVWCEAAALVDHDRRELLLFSWHVPETHADRRVFFDVLAHTWPGWRIQWAYLGLREITAAVGATRAPAAEVPGASVGELAPATGDDHVEFLVTVDDGAAVRAYALWSDLTEVPWYGASLLDMFPESAAVNQLSVVPQSGLHLHVGTRRAMVWTISVLPGLREEWSSLWPGWVLDFCGDDYERHREASGRVVSWPAEDIPTALAALAQRIDTGWRHDPRQRAADILGAIAERQPGVQAGEHFFDHATEAPTSTELDTVRAKLIAGADSPHARR